MATLTITKPPEIDYGKETYQLNARAYEFSSTHRMVPIDTLEYPTGETYCFTCNELLAHTLPQQDDDDVFAVGLISPSNGQISWFHGNGDYDKQCSPCLDCCVDVGDRFIAVVATLASTGPVDEDTP